METKQKIIFELRPLKYVRDFKEKRPYIFLGCNDVILKLVWSFERKVFLVEVEKNG